MLRFLCLFPWCFRENFRISSVVSCRFSVVGFARHCEGAFRHCDNLPWFCLMLLSSVSAVAMTNHVENFFRLPLVPIAIGRGKTEKELHIGDLSCPSLRAERSEAWQSAVILLNVVFVRNPSTPLGETRKRKQYHFVTTPQHHFEKEISPSGRNDKKLFPAPFSPDSYREG